jgi:uncharacterized protein
VGLKIYLDTCVVIYFIEKHPVFGSKIESLINGLSANDEVCFSPLVQMECMVMPLRIKDVQLQNSYKLFFSAQTLVEFSVDIFDEAAQMRADFPSLKTPDALHLATVLHHGCDEFWTNDYRLDAIAPNVAKNIFKP